MITFNLENNDAAFIIQVIGQLPTNTGALPLFNKLQEQAKSQIPSTKEEQQ